MDNPAFHPGLPDIRTAFVLAAPGRKEGEAGLPAAVDTGRNLDRILVHLHRHDPEAFPSIQRYDYRIANALEAVMQGQRTMPDPCDVVEPRNLSRLAAQLQGYDTLVALSNPAIIAFCALGLRATYRHPTHPGMRGMNNRYRLPGREREGVDWRVEERCRLYALDLIASRA